MNRKLALLLVLGAALTWPSAAAGHHQVMPAELEGIFGEARDVAGPAPSANIGSPLDEHSPNMALVGNFDDGGQYRLGSDLAFWGKRAILGNYATPGGFRVVDVSDPAHPSEIGQLECPGPQNDVSIWKDLVFVSVDSPRASTECGAAGASSAAVAAGDQESAWEGVRIVSIRNPREPKQIKAVYTDCGSHTHTLVPDVANKRVLIYVQSYPLTPQGARCNALTHRKISVISVPLNDPASAKVVSTPDVSPAIGCHDTTVLMPKRLAASACLTESQIWDISDLANPKVIAHISNPAINIHHSSTWSWDGNTAVIGDELAGAEATPGCVGDQHAPLGSLWFYDTSNPREPREKGYFHLPQQQVSLLCTAHNFNTIPLDTSDDVLATGWYNGGATVIDFTDPSAPAQLGWYVAKGGTENRPNDAIRATAWSAYWYNGRVFANNFDEDVNSLTEKSRGFDTFAIADPVLNGHWVTQDRLNAQTQEDYPSEAARR